MYRLTSSDELFDIGWEDYLARAACAPWSGARMWRTRWSGTLSGGHPPGREESRRVISVEPVPAGF